MILSIFSFSLFVIGILSFVKYWFKSLPQRLCFFVFFPESFRFIFVACFGLSFICTVGYGLKGF